ncbi:hypothetical protein K469DRAFT_689695 [Zopfia rhizophila CBS 207.26]|uniref:Altered inheritance of mitochondria protein 32 n=1 Tax=Zopfia rhizophila CBS 207.26 TaxID=1314779 RepID=A0A6A6DY37_9PEZI|nr:hypothetical protein K469DRAFT_689695 [Zopfia rhizophila CBS 207.26]
MLFAHTRWRMPSTRFLRRFSASPSLYQFSKPIQWTPACPSPACECAPTPSDLDIDRKSPLFNTMAAYAEQVVICTGKSDWTSRIEDEEGDTGDFVRGVKGVIGKGGGAFDPFNNVMITASSFPTKGRAGHTSVHLFPSFKTVSSIPNSTTSYSAFATAYLKARQLHPAHNTLPEAQKKQLLRDESARTQFLEIEDDFISVLVCGHGGRDKRCGVMGPLLQSEFIRQLRRKGIFVPDEEDTKSSENKDKVKARVGLISHIGGHKYAGNVILYIPHSRSGSALSGMGIWYGRVGPENVEGIVEETIIGGRVIRELFRGGITSEGGNLGRMLEEQEKGDGALKLKPKMRG